MSKKCRVTVLYGEKNTQVSIAVHPSSTVADVKTAGSAEILKHLRSQPGVPDSISIDDECTDFYPDAPDTAKMQDLTGQATVVLWPKSASKNTPSPIMDALSGFSTQVKELKVQLNAKALVEEDTQTSQERKPASDAGNAELITILQTQLAETNKRLDRLDETNKRLEENNKRLEETNNRLEETNKAWRRKLEDTNMTLNTTMQAVLGDRVAINDIRNRVLLDLARDQLAVICGHNNWKAWKVNSENKEIMQDFASTQLKGCGKDVSLHWKHLAGQPTALHCLLFRSRVRSRGDAAAHISDEERIAESVLALTGQERKDMIAIFRAVYNKEPQ